MEKKIQRYERPICEKEQDFKKKKKNERHHKQKEKTNLKLA